MYTKQQLDTMDGISKAFGLSNDIIKGGEGSKGGKVIGHTKSGKPIYDTFEHPAHKDFTGDEHYEAFSHHFDLGNKHAKDFTKDNKREDLDKYLHHVKQSVKHEDKYVNSED